MHWIVTKRDSFLFFMMCRGTRKPTPIVFFFLYLLCVFSIQLHFRPASAFLQKQKCRASSFFFSSFSGLIFHLRIKRSHNFFFLCGLNASSLVYVRSSLNIAHFGDTEKWLAGFITHYLRSCSSQGSFMSVSVCVCVCMRALALCVHALWAGTNNLPNDKNERAREKAKSKRLWNIIDVQ